jgi:hypothetical protein
LADLAELEALLQDEGDEVGGGGGAGRRKKIGSRSSGGNGCDGSAGASIASEGGGMTEHQDGRKSGVMITRGEDRL